MGIPRPDLADYRPRHITQSDEAVKNDCLVTAGLMALDAWTYGEVLVGANWNPLTNAEIKRLREDMRDSLGPGKQTGPLSVADLRTMTKTFFPWIDEPVPFFDAANELRSFAEMVADVQNSNFVGLALGNPIRVKNKASKLRKWTGSDDYDHFVLLERCSKDSFWVMNPLAPYGINYTGENVPISEVGQFVERFGNGTAFVKVSMFKRGAQSTLGETKRRLNLVIAAKDEAIVACRGDLSRTKTELGNAREKLIAANARIADLESRDLQDEVDILTMANQQLESAVEALEPDAIFGRKVLAIERPDE